MNTYNRYKRALQVIVASTAEEATRTVAAEALAWRKAPRKRAPISRSAKMWAERQNGSTYKKIGEKFSLSTNRARVLVVSYDRQMTRRLDAEREAV